MARRPLRALVLFALTLTLGACSEDDPVSPGNTDPAAVRLVAPADGISGIDDDLMLSWEQATDPDGDTVSYDVYLDEQPEPATLVAEGLSATSYLLVEPLPIETTYYWRVVATDGEGGKATSPVRSFSTRDNEAPGVFELLEVPQNATGIDRTPTFTWAESVDPEGDAVVYDLYLDLAGNPSTIVATDLGGTTHTVATPLGIETQYSWRVVARDSHGAERASAVRSFTTRALVDATQVTGGAAFAERAGHTSLVFDGKMWVIGGNTCCGGRYNDVWSSSDGETWTLVTDNAAFPARNAHASAVHDGRMWVIGGHGGGGTQYADAWSSTDGAIWEPATLDAEFGSRYGSCAVSLAGEIWLFGGRDIAGSYSRSHIWRSDDGATWTQVTENAGFGGASNFEILEFQGELWKTGGLDDRVFRSANGSDWTVATDAAPYGERYQHTSVVYDDKLWVLSGSNNDNILLELPDAWFSSDGVTWERAAADAGYTAVASHTSVVFDGRMWIIGGGGGWQSFFVSNEVYSLEY